MQKELEQNRIVVDQIFFKFADLIKPAVRRFVVDRPVHTGHEHILIIRAVKNDDVPSLRRFLVDAPQIIVIELQRRGHLEVFHIKAVGVDAGQRPAHGAVLSAAVHPLKHDQKGILFRGIELFLQLLKLVMEFFILFLNVRFGKTGSIVGAKVFHTDMILIGIDRKFTEQLDSLLLLKRKPDSLELISLYSSVSDFSICGEKYKKQRRMKQRIAKSDLT